jgi:lipoprotein-anchoring transpeptidase ErfK/SrfK
VRVRRRALACPVVLVLVALVVLAGCTGSDGSGATGKTTPPVARLTADPAVGTRNVPVTEPIAVRVTEGKLTDVAVTNAAGKQVRGAIVADGTSWRSTVVLGYGKRYTYRVMAVGTDDKPVEMTGAFRTVVPKAVDRATINPVDEATVGVAMPISINFDVPVSDRAAAERALTVRTSEPVEGSWAWLSDSKVDYRPKEYWPANTDVTVTAKFYGVHFGGGAYGKADLSTKFSVGRQQVVKIDTPDSRMKVYTDGELTASYPTSNGEDGDPNRNTPNGTFIVMEKNEIGNFSNPRYGYTDVLKKWAVRFSNHGEFIHENEENRANIGVANTSHGCVNLTEADSKEYFDYAQIGDPIEVTGSVASMEPRYEVYDWLLDWQTWKAMSAL